MKDTKQQAVPDEPMGYVSAAAINHLQTGGHKAFIYSAPDMIAKTPVYLAAQSGQRAGVAEGWRANVASQCRATASGPLAEQILVDGGNGTLRELLLDAACAILAAPAVAWGRSE